MAAPPLRAFRLVRRWSVAAVMLGLLALSAAPAAAQTQAASADNLNRLSIEELAQIKVTSVSKSEEPLSQAAAAVFVITEEAIHRSGARTLAEILRLAPNLHVARLDANTGQRSRVRPLLLVD